MNNDPEEFSPKTSNDYNLSRGRFTSDAKVISQGTFFDTSSRFRNPVNTRSQTNYG